MSPHPDAYSTLRTSPTLLSRLRDWRDDASWKRFHRLYYRFVFGLAQHKGLSHADAQEVVQEVFQGVALKIHELECRPKAGSFRSWLARRTGWRVAEKFRTRPREERFRNPRREDPTRSDVPTIDRQADPAASGVACNDPAAAETEWQQYVLRLALARLARRVRPRHFQAFELHHFHGWPALRVASELRMNMRTVNVVNHRLFKLLCTEVAHLQQRLL